MATATDPTTPSAPPSAAPAAGRSTPAPPCAVVIFGASGDLTKRMLVPALYNLRHYGLLSEQFAVVGVARREQDPEKFRGQLSEATRQFTKQDISSEDWRQFGAHVDYCQGPFDDPATYERLGRQLAEVERRFGTAGNVLFYLSVPPEYFSVIPPRLAAAGLLKEGAPDAPGENGTGHPGADRWRRVVIEKPFGRDLASAQELARELGTVLEERQIYRIDHYLGKETAQNMLVFRLGNGIFEPIWNRNYVDHVQITASEAIGVEGRGKFYEPTGTLRDVVQNHLFMLLALVAMEPPVSLGGEDIRNEKVKLLRAVRPMTPEQVLSNTVRGQYGPGRAADGRESPGYRQEPDVDPHSPTETFAALKLFIDNWRWSEVPFYLRAGKRLERRETKIVVCFRQAPLTLFGGDGAERCGPSQLIFRIAPDEGIMLQVRAKTPGATLHTQQVGLDFLYKNLNPPPAPATGYEKLIYDAMMGDQTLFQRVDMVEAAWRVATPILDAWAANPPKDFPNYPAGSWGPAAAHALTEREEHRWEV